MIEIKLKVQISRYLSTQLYIIYINTNQRKADRRGSSEKWDDRYPILDNFCSDIASKQKALLERDSFIGYQCYELIPLNDTKDSQLKEQKIIFVSSITSYDEMWVHGAADSWGHDRGVRGGGRMPGSDCRLKLLLVVTVLCLYCMISTLISVTRHLPT